MFTGSLAINASGQRQSDITTIRVAFCAAWAVAVYSFIRKANPLWIGKDQTELFSQMFTKTPATTVGATLDHLKTAALVALGETHKIEELQRGMNYKDHLNLCEPALKNLEGRWNWWHEKQALLAPAMAIGSAAMYASLWAQTIAPHIP